MSNERTVQVHLGQHGEARKASGSSSSSRKASFDASVKKLKRRIKSLRNQEIEAEEELEEALEQLEKNRKAFEKSQRTVQEAKEQLRVLRELREKKEQALQERNAPPKEVFSVCSISLQPVENEPQRSTETAHPTPPEAAGVRANGPDFTSDENKVSKQIEKDPKTPLVSKEDEAALYDLIGKLLEETEPGQKEGDKLKSQREEERPRSMEVSFAEGKSRLNPDCAEFVPSQCGTRYAASSEAQTSRSMNSLYPHDQVYSMGRLPLPIPDPVAMAQAAHHFHGAMGHPTDGAPPPPPPPSAQYGYSSHSHVGMPKTFPSAASVSTRATSSHPHVAPHTNTTLLIRKLPPNFNQVRLKELFDSEGYGGKYDFLYCPYNLSTERQGILGYGFVNFCDPLTAQRIYDSPPRALIGCKIEWARRQGYKANFDAIRNSSLNGTEVQVPDERLTREDYLPMIFDRGEGPMPRKPFPPPDRDVGPMRPRDSPVENGIKHVDPCAICVSDLPYEGNVERMIRMTFAKFCLPHEQLVDVTFGKSTTYAFVRFTSDQVVERIFDVHRHPGGPRERYVGLIGLPEGAIVKVKPAYFIKAEAPPPSFSSPQEKTEDRPDLIKLPVIAENKEEAEGVATTYPAAESSPPGNLGNDCNFPNMGA